MACIAPVGATIGLFEACRIGPDVAPAWRMPWPGAPLCAPGTENALRTVIGRYWMHGNIWLNDPDCLLVRDSETALTLDETRFLSTVIALSGGMVFLSDDLSKLPPERLHIASLLLPPYGRAAVPLDMMERFPPSVLRLEVERPFERWWLQGVLHWGDSAADVVAPLPDEPVHVFDLWEERYFGVQRGRSSPSNAWRPTLPSSWPCARPARSRRSCRAPSTSARAPSKSRTPASTPQQWP